MRVKCIENSKNPNLTINKIYTVYEGEFIADAYERLYIMFKIQDDYGSVIPYDAKYFEISSDKNPNYLEKEISENKYRFTHKFISYDKFWSMLYDEAGTSVDDFRSAKKDIYKLEMSREEICEIIKGDNQDELDTILELLLEKKDSNFIEEVIRLSHKEMNKRMFNQNIETAFLYLSEFKNDYVNNFFIEYLSENEKGNEKLDKIVSDYFNS
ncbi:hypothetical protein M4D81_05540 [Paenibacillus sp. p3-SID867]|uniref:hypothetical protein n=1 Tax=Paenibacillus sp. p3-SID867 TaxID=2916363 RepID=UPI0021A4305D|nr:hypothetical protein [Paenibacillus sp. p3-SID867]MCT1398466.1 hypothetical protein [Paenibacillus sp. p3-SID867]